MLDTSNYAFALELAVLANRREFLNLEKWLPGLLEQDEGPVVTALTILLDRRLGGEAPAAALAPVTIKQIATVWAALLAMMSEGGTQKRCPATICL